MGSGSATGEKNWQVRLVHSLHEIFLLNFSMWYWIKNLHYQIFKFVIDNSDISLNCLQHIQKRRNFDAKVTCHQPICLLLHAILSGVGVLVKSIPMTPGWSNLDYKQESYGRFWARSYMFSVQNPGKMFSEHVLGTQAFILRALWNVLGTASFRFVTGTIRGLRSMTYCVYTAQRVRSFWCALSVLIAVCVLSPAHLVQCSRYRSVHICSGGVLTGSFCSENMVWPCSSWNCSSGNNSL